MNGHLLFLLISKNYHSHFDFTKCCLYRISLKQFSNNNQDCFTKIIK